MTGVLQALPIRLRISLLGGAFFWLITTRF